MYLVSDDYGDFKEIMNYKQLRELLIQEVVDNIKEVKDNDKERFSDCLEHLQSLAKNEDSLSHNIACLKLYGWHIQDILNIQRGINDLREYWARKHTDTKVFDDLLKFIDEDLK